MILAGIFRLARFRADGFQNFGATVAAFLNSLAPMLAFPLVGGVILFLSGALRIAAGNMLVSLVALLAPAVLSHSLALVWRREAQWLRYATAYNWCQAVITLLAVVLVIAMFVALQTGSPTLSLFVALVMALLAYWLVLCWFLASRGLQLNWWRAVLTVVVVNFGTGLLVLGPRWLMGAPL